MRSAALLSSVMALIGLLVSSLITGWKAFTSRLAQIAADLDLDRACEACDLDRGPAGIDGQHLDAGRSHQHRVLHLGRRRRRVPGEGLVGLDHVADARDGS